MKTVFRQTLFAIIAAAALALNSCVGVSADIALRHNGSGRITLEYRVSAMAEALGKLDGNQRWQTVPVGKADFERSLARLPGMKLASFSTKSEGGAVANRAVLDFASVDALVAFLDATGRRAVYTQENGKSRLALVLHEGLPDADGDLLSLLRELSQGYEVRFSFSAPSGAALALTDGAGSKTGAAGTPSARVVESGSKTSLSIGTGELLSLPAGLGMEIVW